MSPPTNGYRFIYVVLARPITDEEIGELESHFADLDDWLRVSPTFWILFTSLKTHQIYGRIRNINELQVIMTEVRSGSEFHGRMPRAVFEWINKYATLEDEAGDTAVVEENLKDKKTYPQA